MADHPPQSLEELRQEYINISRGKSNKRLGIRSIDMLKKMLDEPNETAVMSISEIAQENGINTSSVTRLAQRLGFEGFPSLQAVFRQNLKHRKSFYSEQVKKFLKRGRFDDTSQDFLLQRIIQDEWSNVMLMVDCFDDDKFIAVIDLLVNAEKISVLGLRSSYPLAYYLGFYLKLIRERVSIVGQAGHTIAEDLSNLKSGDVLIAISFSPYTYDTISACRIARQQKVDIVAITDSLSSPLANETENYLITSTQGDYFFTPITAAVICIETILSEVVKHLGNKAVKRLSHTEYILDKLDIET